MVKSTNLAHFAIASMDIGPGPGLIAASHVLPTVVLVPLRPTR